MRESFAVTPENLEDLDATQGRCLDEETTEEGWNILVGVCKRLGRPDLAKRFEGAAARQKMHLQKMRTWVLAALVHQT